MSDRDRDRDNPPRYINTRSHRDHPVQDNKRRRLNDDDIIKIITNDITYDDYSRPDKNLEKVCPNPLCNHKKGTKVTKLKNFELNSIQDLIKIGKTYHCRENRSYNGVDLEVLCKLVEPLTKLDSLVGMHQVKNNILNQIVFFLQKFNERKRCGNCSNCLYDLKCNQKNNPDMLHTVITGPPGVGKTNLGKVLAQLYTKMGILSKGHFTVVNRSDLIAKYLGQTAIKTQKVIDSCRGGVMFIDEAYSLGSAENRDSFAKECIDTLNLNLTERRDFIVIIAGYKENLDSCFFAQNQGLSRRFPFRYHIDGYTNTELSEIFITKVKQEEWSIDKSPETRTGLDKLFKDNYNDFPNYGGDIETLFLNCKITHSKRILFKSVDLKRILTIDDIKNGFDCFCKNKITKEEDDRTSINFMYM